MLQSPIHFITLGIICYISGENKGQLHIEKMHIKLNAKCTNLCFFKAGGKGHSWAFTSRWNLQNLQLRMGRYKFCTLTSSTFDPRHFTPHLLFHSKAERSLRSQVGNACVVNSSSYYSKFVWQDFSLFITLKLHNSW
jgi:hypothetical protein